MDVVRNTGGAFTVRLWIIAAAASLASCASQPPAPTLSAMTPLEVHALIDKSLPASVTDRAGWTADIYAGFTVLGLDPSHESICAVVAVIEQESGFHVDPVIPGLGAIAWREIDSRAAHAGVPLMLVHGVLKLNSGNGRTYSARIDAAKTEKELSDIFEDFIDAVPMGKTLFSGHNPIRTRGPMQVNVAFAEQFAAAKPYPYPVQRSIDDEVFSRRGSLYFGIAHLLDYPAGYDRYLYRFADFNAGQFASRNAALQNAIAAASGIPLLADGALLPHAEAAPGSTELALRALAPRLNLSDADVRSALEQGKTQGLENTALYQRVFALAQQREKHALPRAAVPKIKLQGPKINRTLTTDWYAHRVDSRFDRCLSLR